MKILFIGDIVGKPGRKVIKDLLPGFINDHKVDFVIANGENLANGAGLTEKTAREMFNAGVDVLTGGNHSFHRTEGIDYINSCEKILVPMNIARDYPGRGYGFFEKNGIKIGVINLIGQVFMGPYESPFYAVFDVLYEFDNAVINIVDLHAEATAEKLSFFYLFKGKFSAIIGTHTHVQTNDERVEDGTAYITDVGMTGGHGGVIGVKRELFIKRMVDRLPVRFKPEERNLRFNAVLIDVNESSGKALSIEKINLGFEENTH